MQQLKELCVQNMECTVLHMYILLKVYEWKLFNQEKKQTMKGENGKEGNKNVEEIANMNWQKYY